MAITLNGSTGITTDIEDGTITAAKLSSDIDFGATTINDDATATYSDGEYFVNSTKKAYRYLNDGTDSAWYEVGTKQDIPAIDSETSLSIGYNHSAYITNDGALYVTGSNSYGQLGLNEVTKIYAFKNVLNKNKKVELVLDFMFKVQ